jgi:outer membrane protein
VTAQYHFTGLGRFEPYVGAGAQYINFFNTGTGDNALGATKVNIDPAWGLTLQAGLDFSIGNGWSLNADVKKTFIGRDISWNGTGNGADADLGTPGSSRPVSATASTCSVIPHKPPR